MAAARTRLTGEDAVEVDEGGTRQVSLGVQARTVTGQGELHVEHEGRAPGVGELALQVGGGDERAHGVSFTVSSSRPSGSMGISTPPKSS